MRILRQLDVAAFIGACLTSPSRPICTVPCSGPLCKVISHHANGSFLVVSRIQASPYCALSLAPVKL